MKIKPFILLAVSLIVLFSLSIQTGFAQQASIAKNEKASLNKRKIGDPLENLPKNIEVLTYFGERADISPDNNRIAFMAKSFGDAMVIDVKKRNITCLTCNILIIGL